MPYRPDTLAIHAGQAPDPAINAAATARLGSAQTVGVGR
jgi:hypothetical protein